MDGLLDVDASLSLHRMARMLAFARLCAVAAGLLAGIALLGYVFDLPLLIHVRMGFKGMSPVTATALLALAAAAFASTCGRSKIRVSGAAAAAAAATLVLGFHVAFGTDIVSPWISGAIFRMCPGLTGHMSSATAVGVLLVAASLIMHRRSTGGADLGAALGLLLSSMALLGYLYGVSDLYALPMFNGMALNTAACLFILSMAALLSAPESGLAGILGSDGMGGIAIRRQFPLVGLPVMAGWCLLVATDTKRFGPAIAIALLVIVTVVPLVILVLRDGHALNTLDRLQREKSGMRERRAREDAERFRVVIEASPGAMIMVDSAGLMTLVNQKTEKLFGYDRSELIGRPIEMLVPSCFRVAHSELANGVFTTPGARTTSSARDLSGNHRNGKGIPVEIRLNPIAVEGASFTLAAITDLTRRKRDADGLQARLAAIVKSSNDAIIAHTAEGIVTSWNPAAERLLGYAADEIIGHSIDQLLPPELFADERARIRAVTGGESAPPIDTVRLHKDGSAVDISLALSPMFDERGNVIGVSKIARDIRARRQLEDELLRAKALAEQAAASKGEFLANMSHEIRTPMNAVLGLTQLMARTPLDDEQQSYLTKISGSGRTLLGILNDILDFSKIEAGCLELENVEFQLRLVFQDLSAIMSVAGAEKNLELVVSIDPAIPFALTGDPSRLQQVLINLAGNAIKFTERGTVLVGADLVSREGGAVYIRFTVKDTGIGITAAQQARLFQSFSQADASTTRRFGGTGLGLAICKRLIELMGGSTAVTSEVGIGSTFSFTVAFAEVATASPRETGVGSEPLRSPRWTPRLVGLRILLVEDNLINQQVASAILQQEGGSVIVLDNGRDALNWVRMHRDDVDLVLMDAQMPLMDGPEAARLIRSELNVQDLPIIGLSAAVFQSDRDRCQSAGMNDFLAKPIEVEKLVETILRHAKTPRTLALQTAQSGVSGTRSDGDLASRLAEIPGLDLEQALLRLGGNQILLGSLLRELSFSITELGANLRQDLAADDPKKAASRLHSLRGSGASLGAIKLTRLAGELEIELRRKKLTDVPTMIDKLEDEIAIFCRAVASNLAPAAETIATPAALDDTELSRLIERLDAGDLGVLELYATLSPALRAAMPAPVFDRLNHGIEQLDFNRASKTLELWQAKG